MIKGTRIRPTVGHIKGTRIRPAFDHIEGTWTPQCAPGDGLTRPCPRLVTGSRGPLSTLRQPRHLPALSVCNNAC